MLLIRCLTDEPLTVDIRWDPIPLPAASERSGEAVVVVAGELDIATEQGLVDAFTAALGRHRPRRVRLDLGQVRFIDARGLGALVTCRLLARACDAAFSIEPAGPAVERTLALAGAAHLLRPVP